MKDLFSLYLYAGVTGSVVIVLVILLRLMLKNAPRRLICLMWLLAALSLLIPFRVESPVSLQPQYTSLEQKDIFFQQDNVQPVVSPEAGVTADVKPVKAPPTDFLYIAALVWLTVATAAGTYAAISYFVLKYRVRKAVEYAPGIMMDGEIRGAFILGYFRPCIYLPTKLDTASQKFIISHERVHIAKGDHWLKLLGFVCLCLHWYNPLVWLCYMLLCRDIEIACDEQVVRKMEMKDRKAYSMALLHCAKSVANDSICPVAFSDMSLKQRVKSVLSYRKPAVWITIITVLLIVAMALLFLTAPERELQPTDLSEQNQTETPFTTTPETVATEEPSEAETTVATEKDTVPTTAPTEPVTEPPTEPKPTEPKPTEPKPVTPPSQPGTGDSSQQIIGVPDYVLYGDRTPQPDTPLHTHRYVEHLYSPVCGGSGYTYYKCSCGHEYFTDFQAPTGHDWKFDRYREATACYDGGDMYVCTKCNNWRWENFEPAITSTYDYESIDRNITGYAADYGFQTMDSGPNSVAQEFSYIDYADSVVIRGGQSYMRQMGHSLVDRAYSYCQEKGYIVSQSCIWAEVYYSSEACKIIIRVYCATV